MKLKQCIQKNDVDTSDVINELIDFFMKRYQEGLETKMKRSSLYLNMLIY